MRDDRQECALKGPPNRRETQTALTHRPDAPVSPADSNKVTGDGLCGDYLAAFCADHTIRYAAPIPTGGKAGVGTHAQHDQTASQGHAPRITFQEGWITAQCEHQRNEVKRPG